MSAPRRKVDAMPVEAPAVDVAETAAILKAVEAVLGHDGASRVPPEAIQNLIAAGCRAYAARIEAGDSFPPVPNRGPVTSTDVMVTVSALLKAVDLNTFELGMWQSWTGR